MQIAKYFNYFYCKIYLLKFKPLFTIDCNESLNLNVYLITDI